MDFTAQSDKILARMAQVEGALQDPDLMTDIAKMTALNREYAQLKPIFEACTAYKQLLSDKAEAEKMLTDPSMKALGEEELARIRAELPAAEEELKVLLLPPDEDDDRNVILEIRGGTGGEEAALFAGDIFKMYQLYAQNRGWGLEIQDTNEGDKGGYKEIISRLSGHNVYQRLKFESGVHRVQRVPATETQGRVHTSAATVVVLPEAEEADVQIAATDLRIDVYRSSGPGGQSVNTTDSAVRITHVPTGVVVVCQDEKSQHKNKAKAMTILRSRLLAAEREKQAAEQGAARKSMVGSGDRSEKIRTYNYPQNRVTDHRIELTIHNLPDTMAGGKTLDEMMDALQRADQAAKLEQMS